ncbi:hypothetical protein JG687_00017968 [Phytophthora cactorum]|uniref:Uncharacterized protein n=1 Tax=Phytophthora cactorum TaxID=29920 RepID=A0A8T1TLY8_9STRA|nr:hypothetical protein JG687_00017968 [Phytophthora cactorum]
MANHLTFSWSVSLAQKPRGCWLSVASPSSNTVLCVEATSMSTTCAIEYTAAYLNPDRVLMSRASFMLKTLTCERTKQS